MKIAIISLVSHLREFSTLGDIDMCLSHLVLSSQDYALFYKERSRKEHVFQILDNSAFELETKTGKGLNPVDVIRAAELVEPSELICTDVLFKPEETLKKTFEFIEYFYKYQSREAQNHPRHWSKDVKLMVVPQGETMEEWLWCYEAMLQIPNVHTIGLSKVSVPQCWVGNREEPGAIAKGRIMCVSEIIARGLTPDKYGKEIHLLGSDAWMGYEARVQAQHPWIRSMDSSAPVWYGMKNEDMDYTTGRFRKMITDKPDLENEDTFTETEIETHKEQIYRNIAIVQTCSKGK